MQNYLQLVIIQRLPCRKSDGGSRDCTANDRWQTVVWYLPNYPAAPRAASAFHYPSSLLGGCRHEFTPRVLVSVKLSKSANAGTNWERQAGLGTQEQTPSCGLCRLPALTAALAGRRALAAAQGRAGHPCGSCPRCASTATVILLCLLTNYVSPKSHLQPSTQMAINHSLETKRVLRDI